MDFTGRVAIVTGRRRRPGPPARAGAGARAARKVVVNDLGGAVDGSGGSPSAAQRVVDEIRAAGGEAIANGASVTDFDGGAGDGRSRRCDAWGRVDILVNNAGILRDKSFAKMELADFRARARRAPDGRGALLQGACGR